MASPDAPRPTDPAAAEPFFTVLSRDEFRMANLTPQARQRFFASGEADVKALLSFIHSRIDPEFTPASVLEYGCGPGRLALPLARRYATVVAVDSSEAMLAKAREFAETERLDSLRLIRPEELFAGSGKFELVSCHLVLQRMERRAGLDLVRSLAARIGGIGVFHLPVADRTSGAVRAVRWSRTHVPGANAAVNLARRKAIDARFDRTTIYDLAEVLSILAEAGFDAPMVSTARQGDFDAATLYAFRKRSFATSTATSGPATTAAAERNPAPSPIAEEQKQEAPRSALIDVRELLARTTIEQLNATAETYFSSLTEWEHHLTKPFNKPEETPGILMNLGGLLQGMALEPGLTVLDYGAGSGWLSRFLTQLGCLSILLDVSASALRIARETFARIPIVGDRPEPTFLQFDGRRIELQDESVDRIVCFDAFHHAPNPDQILREFARILRPGGIAGFSEPGPQHSQMPQSQFEMRTYGVLENDIDLAGIWEAARSAGFNDVRVATFVMPPFHTSLDGYHDLLEGGATFEEWARVGRDNLHHVRNFFLHKPGLQKELDSRHPAGLIAEIVARQTGPRRFAVTVTNTGEAVWLPSGPERGGVSLGVHLYDSDGALLKFDQTRSPLSTVPLAPNDSATVELDLGALPAGHYRVEFDCVAERVIWFTQVGSRTAVVNLDVPGLTSA